MFIRLWYSFTQLVGLPSSRPGNSTDHYRRYIDTHALGPKEKAYTAAAACCHR